MDATLKFTFEDGTEALVHYGVLGMRWGVRHDDKYKAQKKDIKAKAKAAWAKVEADRKAGKFKSDAAYDKATNDIIDRRKKAINKAKVDTANRLYSGNSKEANKRIQTRSTAKTLGLNALMGSYGTLHYDRARAEGNSKGKSAVKGVLANAVNQLTYQGYGAADYAQDRAARKHNMRSHDTTTNDYSFSGEGGQSDELRARRLKKRLANA